MVGQPEADLRDPHRAVARDRELERLLIDHLDTEMLEVRQDCGQGRRFAAPVEREAELRRASTVPLLHGCPQVSVASERADQGEILHRVRRFRHGAVGGRDGGTEGAQQTRRVLRSDRFAEQRRQPFVPPGRQLVDPSFEPSEIPLEEGLGGTGDEDVDPGEG